MFFSHPRQHPQSASIVTWPSERRGTTWYNFVCILLFTSWHCYRWTTSSYYYRWITSSYCYRWKYLIIWITSWHCYRWIDSSYWSEARKFEMWSLSYNCYQIADHCAKGFQWGLLLQRLWLLFGISYRWRHKLLVFHTCSIHVYLTFVIRNLYGTDYHLLQFKKAFDKSKCTLYIVLLNVMLNYCLNIWLRLLQNLVATAQLFLKYNS